eukprot:g3883.t1
MDDNAGNKGLDSLIQAFTSGDVNVYDRNTTFSNPFNFRSLMPYDFPERYYSYQGSLTTPPCFESVTWVLASTKERISVKQLQAFRDLKYMDNADGAQLPPMQVQRFRTVFKSFQDSYTSSQRPVYDPTEEPTEEEDNQTPKRDPGVMAMSASGDDNSSWQAVVIAAIVIASCAFTLFLVLLCFFFCRPQMGKRAVAPGENTHRLLERGDTTREEFASRPAPVAAVSSNEKSPAKSSRPPTPLQNLVLLLRRRNRSYTRRTLRRREGQDSLALSLQISLQIILFRRCKPWSHSSATTLPPSSPLFALRAILSLSPRTAALFNLKIQLT